MADFINTIDVLGDDAVIDSIINRTITEFKDNTAAKIGYSAFANCEQLTIVDLPAVTALDVYAFQNCSALTNVNLPAVTGKLDSAFQNCRALKSIKLPRAEKFELNSFASCYALTSVDLTMVTTFGGWALQACWSLTRVIMRGETVATLAAANVFANCYHFLGTTNADYNPNGAKDGYFYVPKALVDSYKTATNWSSFADQFRALEDYTVDGTITGELDETKI